MITHYSPHTWSQMSMVEVMGLSINHSSELPCGTAQFDPYRRSFFKQELEHRKVQVQVLMKAEHMEAPALLQAHGAPLAGGVAAVCVAAVLATALLVTVLHRWGVLAKYWCELYSGKRDLEGVSYSGVLLNPHLLLLSNSLPKYILRFPRAGRAPHVAYTPTEVLRPLPPPPSPPYPRP